LKYGQDPRRIAYAGSDVDGASVDFTGKYAQSQQTIKDRYADFEVPYNGTDNDDYVNGGGFCCDDNPKLRAGAIGNGNDNPEIYQYYYHSDHLGSTSLITDLDGDIVQHVEYVPFGEVFIEERNNKWNTPYLFNAKELDEETGLYYYGARYYDPRVSIWLSADPMQEKYPGISTYAYCAQNPVRFVDTDGRDVIILENSAGASRRGHQAILVGTEERGWLYISKDGAAKNGTPSGPSRYTAKYFKSLDEFKNSAHNFEVTDDTNHSKVGGGEEPNLVFKLDENGNKIQRYDQAYYIDTDEAYDGLAAYKAIEVAK